MGEIADDLMDGSCCGFCSSYFEEEHGYPVLCKSCWRKADTKEREGYQEAINREM
jgi:hypothetical protein